MTTLIDRLRIWASSGTKTKPADSKIDTGWVGGEQPPHEYENERMNARDTQLVGCVDAVNDSTAGGRSLFKDRNIAPVIPENIGFPYSADNFYDSGDAEINAACLYDYQGTKLLLFSWVPAAGTSYIKAYNVNTKANTNYAFTGDLVLDMCSTGRYIYILYANLNGTDYDYFLTAVDGADWSAMPGWPGSDPQLGSEPSASIDGRPFCKVTPLGNILCGGRWYGTAADDKLSVIDSSDGSVLQSGDAGLGATYYPSGDCVVVGDTMAYSGLVESTGAMFLASIYEADLSLGGVERTRSAPSTAGEFMALVSLGDHFIEAQKGGSVVGIQIYDESFTYLTWSGVVAANSGTKLGPMVFDGVHLWALFRASTGLGHGMLVRKISPQSFGKTVFNQDIDFDVDTDNNYLLDPALYNDTLGYMRPGMIFDGSGVWVSPHAPDGTTFSGQWFRVGNVHNR